MFKIPSEMLKKIYKKIDHLPAKINFSKTCKLFNECALDADKRQVDKLAKMKFNDAFDKCQASDHVAYLVLRYIPGKLGKYNPRHLFWINEQSRSGQAEVYLNNLYTGFYFYFLGLRNNNLLKYIVTERANYTNPDYLNLLKNHLTVKYRKLRI